MITKNHVPIPLSNVNILTFSGVPPPRAEEIEWTFKNNKLNFYSLKHRIDVQAAKDRIFKIISVLQISNTQLSDQGMSLVVRSYQIRIL